MAQHGEVQLVVAAEVEPEEATTAKCAETSVSKEPARTSRATRERAHG